MTSSMRKELLDIFSQHEGEFISGQKISNLLGCSRTAVWKHIEELRKDGYELEAVQRKGYRIIGTPDKISENAIRLGLRTTKIGQNIHYEDSVDSTQKIAHQLANSEAPNGTIVVSDEQTLGRGRLDRTWYSPKGTGIWMSVILRPNIQMHKAPQLTLLTAVSVVRGIKKSTGIECQIKWPNDILINEKKCVGILTEMQADADRIRAVIIGIGINVNHRTDHFPEELQQIATSLAIEKGEEINRASVMQAILKEMEDLYEDYLKEGFSLVKTLWEANAVSIGKRIRARMMNETVEGYAKGITGDGVLLLETDDGKIRQIYSADIEIPPTT
ncbi:biotin--[acetyl-CoA-carboxylase] ligase [Bacillus solimangrovi]|uniref:Bifunctional ligase/repressor BirA n=1 Tax=Bacillus solimangrovi TaxID=1305675 RepID=A0A1E5LH74_9BACI|nr:biotin--[acetyl-CoA-carboxylase] ligase [Bacillus solimangrovi]OEH93425.1 bifunctional biotin--[acetyl-CoA-carboxylase] synthetase/biotin operon repressor [Bacillus solimangrovi]